ncbi:chemotaxis protein MotB [Maritimibacter sp. 55A14]|uniref:flagellar motor protein MotB n=1 Tax=Maritimibacter sp. 55A14 TaxID=2174844 RepID=UPI000D611DAA|nr:flagellar motor protein MotB [Maritimibacter sp. 55A14]PWE33447.1 chemotaxis protein MotB [Maritimibacter sp. 55A14]
MSVGDNSRPIIIKRKKVSGGDGHHGGAWKVAYADFVTAMMAFFMLMWLLNATTEKQRKGLADYFNPTISVNRVSGGGDGAFSGDSIFTEETLVQTGTGASARHPTEIDKARGATGSDPLADGGVALQDAALKRVEEALRGNSGESQVEDELLVHVRTRVSDEGLIVELFDLPGQPLFLDDGTGPAPVLRQLSAMLAEVFALVSNDVAVAAHTRSRAIVLLENPIWDLSAGRAQEMRRLLEGDGFPPARVQRVTGWADRRLTDADPMAGRNDRLEVTLLRADR